MSFFFFFFVFSGVVLGPTGVVHLRTLMGRTCNLRYYALPESHVTDDVTCDGKFWNMGVVCVCAAVVIGKKWVLGNGIWTM